MVKIIGIAGKKQSGKNTMANYIHGRCLSNHGIIHDFKINSSGQLEVETQVDGESEFGILDITRKDNEFCEYAHYNMWPFIKLYSFADGLKQLCMQFFNLSFGQVYGTDEQKNTNTNIEWINTPTWENSGLSPNRGYMTARELLQYFGTDVMRKMYTNVWVDHAIKTIKSEQSEVAVIADVRFPNEVEAIKKAGGKVIRLTREKYEDSHSSESALDKDVYDWDNFDLIVDNSSGGLEGFCKKLNKIYKKLEL